MANCIRLLTFVVSTSLVACAMASLKAQHPPTDGSPCGCQQGNCENKQFICRSVPESKPIKKVVYEARRVPFCMHCLSGHHCRNGHCQRCEGTARWKTVLVKREIKCGEKTEWKCVAEEVACGSTPCSQCGSASQPEYTVDSSVQPAKLPSITPSADAGSSQPKEIKPLSKDDTSR